jgi:hypothetical protein
LTIELFQTSQLEQTLLSQQESRPLNTLLQA